MASFRARFLAVMAQSERSLAQLFRDLAAGIAADVARRADGAGVVPRTATFELQRQSAERIQRLYLGRNRAGELAPFETLANGRVIALAPYPQALWAAISAAVRLPVEENAAILTKRLPDDILDVLKRARVDPFQAVGAKVAEVEVFRPNPLANYEAPHTWVDPNGYRLSDRIWNTATTERAKLDAYLADAIQQGKGALTMAKELEQFLDPSRKTLTTNKPYGTKASYDAMRLARTEITRAHTEAQRVAAAMNPFVTGLKWVLSPRHPKPDICDSYARGGPNGDGVYPLDQVPGVPHPQCLCARLNALADDPDAVIDALRADIRKARAELVDKIGPVQVEAFDKLLLGETLPGATGATGAADEAAARRRQDELNQLRDRLTFTADDNLNAELAALNQRISQAQAGELTRLLEERRIFEEVRKERAALEAEQRRREEQQRLEAERLRQEAEALRQQEAARLAEEARSRAANQKPELTPIEARDSFARITARADAIIAENRKVYLSYDAKISKLYDQQTKATRSYERAKTDEQRLTADRKLDQIENDLRSLYRERDDRQRAIKRAEEQRAEEIRQVVYVRNPANNTLVLSGADPADAQQWQNGMNEFNKLVSRDVLDGKRISTRILPAGGRAHYDGTVAIAPGDGTWVMVHELGHWLDDINPRVLQRSLAFYDRRTAGETLEKMSAITGNSGYGDDELTRKDKFVEPYIGKDYGRTATEVVSMGIQYMYQDPLKFANDDPDMFDFIFGLLRGR